MVLSFVPRMSQIWPIGTEIWFRTDKKWGRTDAAKTISPLPTKSGDKKNKNEILLLKKVSYDSFIKKKWLTTMI